MSGYGFRHAARMEWIKLTSVRSTWWLATAAVLSMATAGVGVGLGYRGHTPVATTAQILNNSLSGAILAQLLLGALGVLAVTGEYGTGMIRSTFAAVPRRRTVLAAAGPAGRRRGREDARAQPGRGSHPGRDRPAHARVNGGDSMRVVIAEDAAMMRAGLVRLLADRGFEVCAAVADADVLRSAVAASVPDVAVVDIRMPPTHTDEGLRAAIDIRRDHPGVGVLLFSQYVETRYATRLLAAWPAGVGYLLKDRVADVADFVDALTRVASGGTALDPEVVGHLMRAGQGTAGVASLTPREREVLSLMAEGRSNSGIAAALVITPGVVEKHVANIFAKLGLPASDTDNRRVLAVLRHLGG